jgi:hypothetical protein
MMEMVYESLHLSACHGLPLGARVTHFVGSVSTTQFECSEGSPRDQGAFPLTIRLTRQNSGRYPPVVQSLSSMVRFPPSCHQSVDNRVPILLTLNTRILAVSGKMQSTPIRRARATSIELETIQIF